MGFLQQDSIGLGSGEDMLQFQSQFQNRYTRTKKLKKKEPQKGNSSVSNQRASHLRSAGWAGCWQVEGSCKIWPGEPAASRG